MHTRLSFAVVIYCMLLVSEASATPAAPLQSYDTLVDEVSAFLMSDVGTGGIRLDGEEPVPPYFYHYGIFDGGGLWSSPVNYPGYASVSYPGYTASVGIDAFLAYWRYSGNPEALARAVHYAEWILRHLTPAGDLWARVPYSTQTDGIMGGGWDGEAIETDKPPMFGLRLLELHDITGEPRYLAAADTIAMSMIATQLSGGPEDDGRWHWRARPSDGLVTQDYGSHLVPAVRFLDAMGQRMANPDYSTAADRAWAWLLANPLNPASISYNRWEGFYEDQSPDMQTGFPDHYSSHQVIEELLVRRPAGWQDMALGVMGWVRANYLIDGPGTEVSDYWPATYEWSGWPHATFASTMQFAHTARLLYDALEGDPRQDPTLLSLAAGMTLVTNHGQNTRGAAADGRMFTTVKDIWSHYNVTSWYEQNFNTVIFVVGMMGLDPELAPGDEDHLLSWSDAVTALSYEGPALVYKTESGSGEELLKMVAKPVSVQVAGVDLPEVSALGVIDQGWSWDAATQLVRVRHLSDPVEIWHDVTSPVLSSGSLIRLGSPSPNPANPMLVIPLESSVATEARVTVMDARGRLIRELWQGPIAAGRRVLRWDGRDANGRAVASGTYVVQLLSSDGRDTRRVSLIR